jgi:hypothetical protein
MPQKPLLKRMLVPTAAATATAPSQPVSALCEGLPEPFGLVCEALQYSLEHMDFLLNKNASLKSAVICLNNRNNSVAENEV